MWVQIPTPELGNGLVDGDTQSLSVSDGLVSPSLRASSHLSLHLSLQETQRQESIHNPCRGNLHLLLQEIHNKVRIHSNKKKLQLMLEETQSLARIPSSCRENQHLFLDRKSVV